MKTLPPINWWKVAGQGLFFSMFCLSLWHLLDMSAQKEAYRMACSRLASQEERLGRIQDSLSKYRLLRKHYLPCKKNSKEMLWQHITADFRDISLDELIENLRLLYSDIENLYGKNVIFFLDEFEFRPLAKGTPDRGKDMTSDTAEKIFSIKGKLLTPCSHN